MRRLVNRLLVALIPYTGLFTVSTCGGPADCEESGQSKTVVMTAKVEGDIALDTARNERIETSFVKEGGGSLPEWRCEARVVARAVRDRADTSMKRLPSTAQVFCSIGDGRITRRQWTFTVPLDDLREDAIVAEAPATMDVSLQDFGDATVSCSAKVPVVVKSALASSTGAPAAPPSWVSKDFARTIASTITVVDAAADAADRGCAQPFAGAFALDISIDASSFAESDTPTCL